MSTVIAVVGTIAGAGTTTVATALGTALGEQRRRVALVDATAEGSRIDDVVDVAGGGEVVDALRRGTTVADAQATVPHDVAAFTANQETGWGAVRPDAVGTFYEELRERFEFVLVDCGCSLSIERTAWLGHADEAVIVTDPDVAETASELDALTSAFEVPVRGVIANRVPSKAVDDALETLAGVDAPAIGVLPEDPTVGVAAASGTSVLRAEPDSPIATCVWKLALRVRETDHDEPVVPPGAALRATNRSDESTTGHETDRSTDARGTAGPAEPEEPTEDEEPHELEERDELDQDDPDATDDDATEAAPTDTADVPDRSDGTDEEATRSGGEPMPAASPAEAGFVTPDPRPVESSESGDADPAETGEDATDDAVGSTASDDGRTSQPAGVEDGSDGTGSPDDADEADDGEESAELSDEEIEAVFQETMDRVTERRDEEMDE